jgi:hypothetical protein
MAVAIGVGVDCSGAVLHRLAQPSRDAARSS